MTTHAHRDYLPAFSHDHLLPLYDPLVRLLGADRARLGLIEQAALRPGQRVLDVGCGTGTFAVALKRQLPGLDVVGVDPDPQALARSERKARRAGVEVRLDRGFGTALPYPDASFDRLFSAYVVHHVPPGERPRFFAEMARVLRPGGGVHVLDFAGPDVDRAGVFERRLHASAILAGNGVDEVLGGMREAGFADAHVVARRALRFGRVVYYRAARRG